ncbi:MAG: oligosaccharide flippase family protein [Pseudomonadota bacterium]
MQHLERTDGGLFLSVMGGVRWSLLFRVSGAAFAFAIAVLTARLLDVEGYGQLQYVLGVLNIVFVLGGLGLAKIVIREIAVATNEARWGQPRGALLFATLSGATATLLFGLVAYWSAIRSAQSDLTGLFILGLGVFLLRQIQVPLASFMNGLRRISFAGLGDFLRDMIIVITLLGLLLSGSADRVSAQDVMLVRLCSAVLILTLLVVLYRRVSRELPGDWLGTPHDFAPGAWLRAGLPLMLVAATSVLLQNTDIIMLGLLSGPDDVGLYHAASRSQVLVIAAVGITVMPLAPVVSSLHAQRKIGELRRLVRKTTTFSVCVALPGTMALVLFAEELLLLFGPDFPTAASAMRILAVFAMAYTFFGPAELLLIMTDHQVAAGIIAGSAAVLNGVLNLALIPSFGLEGAALATGISTLILKMTLWLYVGQNIWKNR